MTQLQCLSPIDGTVYARRQALTPEQAERLVTQARSCQQDWANRPLEERIRLVSKGIESLGTMENEPVVELARMMGRPVRYGGEFSGAHERASHMAAIAAEALAPTVIESSASFVRQMTREPLGVILVVSPWNYPYLTAINVIVPALIAGNTLVFKGATQTLLVGERLERAFRDAGLPDGVIQNAFLDHATTQTLIAQRRFDFIHFTGSVAGGKIIEQAAAGTFTGVGLELGGKDPAYVAQDADIALSARELIDAAMFNSGQSCCGIERIYVHERVFSEFVEKAKDEAERLILGNPLDHHTTLGPMAHERFATHVRQHIQNALSDGAKLVIDPKTFPNDGGAYLAPQILLSVHHGMPVMRQESFGPIVGVMSVASDHEAVERMNDSDYGLTASLWTTDHQRAIALGAKIQAGTIYQNRADYLDPALCWTGQKHTGRGQALSVFGYHNLTRIKSYHLKKMS